MDALVLSVALIALLISVGVGLLIFVIATKPIQKEKPNTLFSNKKKFGHSFKTRRRRTVQRKSFAESDIVLFLTNKDKQHIN